MYLKLTSRKYGQKQLVNMDRVLWVQPDGGEGDGSVLYFDLEEDDSLTVREPIDFIYQLLRGEAAPHKGWDDEPVRDF